MLIDNRPTSNTGTGGGGDETAIKEAIKTDWKVVQYTITGLDIVNSYIPLANPPKDTKVLVKVLGMGDLDNGLDYTINVGDSRVEFSVDMNNFLAALFNEYGTIKIKSAYFAA